LATAVPKTGRAAGWRRSTLQRERHGWRAYSTGPDRDVLIGNDFRPFYGGDRGADLGVSTWPAEAWKIGGARVSGFISYDSSLNLIYYGTANPAPWNPHQRPGDNKWTAGIFARDAASGDARWFYQTNPHDLHAYGGGNENVLVDSQIGGTSRKVLLHPDRKRLSVRHRPCKRPDAVRRALRSRDDNRRGSTRIPTNPLCGADRAPARQGRAGGVSRIARRQELATVGLLAAHATALPSSPELVPGSAGLRRQATRRYAPTSARRSRFSGVRPSTAGHSAHGTRRKTSGSGA
jgi:hypothetical protein